MSAEEHARAKTIFFGAIDISQAARQGFVKEACAGNERLEREVKSLLAHHRNKTLLPKLNPSALRSAQENCDAPAESPLERQASKKFGDSILVLSQLWDENRQLLRRRWQSFTAILGIALGYSIFANAFQSTTSESMISRVSCFVVVLLCWYFLRSRQEASLWQLRCLELVISGTVVVLFAAIGLLELRHLSRQGDTTAIIFATVWDYAIWSMLILTYGVFVPNTWARAAWLLLPVATIPYLIELVAERMFPEVAAALQPTHFRLPLPLPWVAAGIAISAAHVIHGARLSAFRARRLAQYELLHEIGTGGMGKVYEGRHVMLKRPCAIKVIQPDRSTDVNSLQNFEREARATSRLSHPHTIEIYDFGQTNEGLFFYVMELLPGTNLRDLVEVSGPLAPARAVHFLVQICGALEEAHQLGLIHRDIKPANIFASERGGIQDFAKLLDFGLVRQLDSEIDHANAAGNFTAGTPAYMSPEQIVNYRNIDSRSDLYSLGAVAYFLLVGQPPFVRDSYLDVLSAHIREPVLPPISLKPELGLSLNAIILKCLEKSPEDRFASARQLREALSDCEFGHNWHQHDALKWWTQFQELSRNGVQSK